MLFLYVALPVCERVRCRTEYAAITDSGAGVGRALLDAAEEWGRSNGFRRLTLAVFTDNRRAKEFYARGGWQPELETYFRNLAEG